MYSFDWNPKTGGYVLNTKSARFVAHEIRPVFAEELKLVGFDAHFKFDENETRPICWARQNVYIHKGEEIARLDKTQYGKPLNPVFLARKGRRLTPVDVDAMLADDKNRAHMDALVADTLKRLKEMFDQYARSCDIAYIGFSGGKDSVVLLDLCHRALPLTVPVVFSDTDMELPDTYAMWDEIQMRYPDRPFHRARAAASALDNWRLFGPPSRTIRWCCSIHKSTPAILLLRNLIGKASIRTQAFLGVRNEESNSRAEYDDIGVGVKNASQINSYPILKWGAHELWFYTLAEKLLINHAYCKGLQRVGCVLCPESTERYGWFVNAIYPKAIGPYKQAILDAVDKKFETTEDKVDYLATAGWQARKSGETLKEKIYRPQEKQDGETIAWTIPTEVAPRIREWLKTLGVVQRRDVEGCDDDALAVEYATNGTKHQLEVDFDGGGDNVSMRVRFESLKEIRDFAKYVRQCVFKSLACVGCRSCEAECPARSLSFVPGFSIDAEKCIHCLNCHNPDYGCWRYKSMSQTNSSNNELSAINKYTNFGLREEWVAAYVRLGVDIANPIATSLGTKMVPAAKAWFRQALLMDERTCDSLPIMGVVERDGVDSQRLWDCIWIALANRAPLVKWVCTALELGKWYSRDEQYALLGSDIKDATKKGGISALNDMLTKSPLGRGDGAMVAVEMKGRQVAALMRKAHEPEPLALLYGLFVMAEAADRDVFSVTSMMTADATASFVSPLAAFGMGPESFKRVASGLADRYPDFLRVRFAQGLDEVELKRGEGGKTSQDVVRIMLGE